MNAAEHIAQAERLHTEAVSEHSETLLADAQYHATMAVAKSLNVSTPGPGGPN